MTYEKDRAIFESEKIAATDAYFSARPGLNSLHNRRMFEEGFRQAWDIKATEELNDA